MIYKNRIGLVLTLLGLGCLAGCSAESTHYSAEPLPNDAIAKAKEPNNALPPLLPNAIDPESISNPQPSEDANVAAQRLAVAVVAKPSVIVVRPLSWHDSLAAWAKYRSEQYDLRFVDSVGSANEQHIAILSEIARCSGEVRAIVLCGDVAGTQNANRNKQNGTPSNLDNGHSSGVNWTPAFSMPTQVKLGNMTTPTLCTDVLYGDTDDDGCPEIAVGRLPAKNPDELARMLQKSITYETQAVGPWKDQIHVTAGIGGFGLVADSAIEAVTRRFLTEGIPDTYQLNMTYASLSSVYCPDPYKLRESFIQRINRGGLFWVYIGHGNVTHLDYFQIDRQWEPICNAEHVSQFHIENGPPIALLLACFTGAFDANVDCFGEELLALENGPVAVIAGSRVTMPYGLSELAGEMMQGCFQRHDETLGQVLVNAKRAIWNTPSEPKTETSPINAESDASTDPNRDLREGTSANTEHKTTKSVREKYHDLITRMAEALSPDGHELQAERREHVRLMNLLGDPLLKIPYPKAMEMQAPDVATPGETITVRGNSPVGGNLLVALKLMRDRIPDGVQSVGEFDGSDEKRQRMSENYLSANDLTLSTVNATVQPGDFEVKIAVPAEAKGRCIVTGYIYTANQWAVGSSRISIRKPRTKSSEK